MVWFLMVLDRLNGQITHPDPVVFKASGRAARVQCKVDSSTLRSSVIHWYRAPPKGALQRLMYFEAGSPKATKDPDTPRRFSGSVSGSNHFALKINKLKKEHLAMYYCACWDYNSSMGWIKRFGSGTRLIVTDQVKAPTLFGYLPSKKDEKKSDGHGKQTMLCQASGMFPDLVKFAWKKKDAGKWGDVSEGDVVEQRNDGQEITVTSMLIVDKDKARNNDYQCTVVHEGKTEELEMKRGNLKKL
uniref:Ig-like domain-containing protein n=1 Tax=Cyprinus carpio TaxID=7962 RepID=A0A8C2C1X4_CYPCA